MYIVIFTDNLSRARKIGVEIIDKLSWIGVCRILHEGTTFEFPSRNIVIDIRKVDILKSDGLRPNYFLLDENCSYEFCEYVKRWFERKGNEALYSMRHLIMKIAEIVLYGEEK